MHGENAIALDSKVKYIFFSRTPGPVLKASFKALAEIGERVSGTGERWSEIKK
jgi:hypothetical protein